MSFQKNHFILNENSTSLMDHNDHHHQYNQPKSLLQYHQQQQQHQPPSDVFMDTNTTIENFEIGSKNLQIFLIILYSITAALALFGNLLSIVVLIKGKRSSRDLRLFLINLSLSDILMSIFSIPFTYTHFIMGRWIFYPPLCPFIQSTQIVSVFVSIYTLTTIGIDRYIAIMKPFIINFWTKSFAPIIIVILTWLISGCLGMIIWFYSNVDTFIVNNITYYDCHETWTTQKDEQIYTIGIFLSAFAIPLTCLIYFYGSICFKLWYHCAPGNANITRDNAQYQAKRKVIKMLITIVALFAICWFPSHLFHLIRVFNKDLLLNFIGNDASSPKYLVIVLSSHWLSMAHSFVNPIIYSFMSDNFKADVKYMIKKFMIKYGYCCFCCSYCCCKNYRGNYLHHHHHHHHNQNRHHLRHHRHYNKDDEIDDNINDNNKRFNNNKIHDSNNNIDNINYQLQQQQLQQRLHHLNKQKYYGDECDDYEDDYDDDEYDEDDDDDDNGTKKIEMIFLNTNNNNNCNIDNNDTDNQDNANHNHHKAININEN